MDKKDDKKEGNAVVVGVQGILLTGITDKEADIFDIYEADEYEMFTTERIIVPNGINDGITEGELGKAVTAVKEENNKTKINTKIKMATL